MSDTTTNQNEEQVSADPAAANPQAPANPASPVTPSEFPLSIDEFCTRLRATDKRIEMIGAFALIERSEGRVRDTETNYRSRFEALATRPA